MTILKYEHSSSYNEVLLDYEIEDNTFILCAIERDFKGNNIQQIDLGSYSPKLLKRMLKSLLKIMKRRLLI